QFAAVVRCCRSRNLGFPALLVAVGSGAVLSGHTVSDPWAGLDRTKTKSTGGVLGRDCPGGGVDRFHGVGNHLRCTTPRRGLSGDQHPTVAAGLWRVSSDRDRPFAAGQWAASRAWLAWLVDGRLHRVHFRWGTT